MKNKPQVPPNQHFPPLSVAGLNPFSNHCCIGQRKKMFAGDLEKQAKSNPAVEVPVAQ